MTPRQVIATWPKWKQVALASVFGLEPEKENGMSISESISEFESNVDRLFVKPDRHDSTGRLVQAVLGAAGEIGELVDAVKKHWIYGKDLDTANIEEEIGDVLFYLQALASECGLSLQGCMDWNVEKLRQRYPDGYSDEAANARMDKGE